MQTTDAVGSDAPILRPSSAGSVNYRYVAAALAIRRGLFLKQNGDVNYSSAARHYLADTGTAHGGQVKEWVRKLELLDQAKGQATLETLRSGPLLTRVRALSCRSHFVSKLFLELFSLKLLRQDGAASRRRDSRTARIE